MSTKVRKVKDYSLKVDTENFNDLLTSLYKNLIDLDSSKVENSDINIGLPLSPVKKSVHRKELINSIQLTEDLLNKFKILQKNIINNELDTKPLEEIKKYKERIKYLKDKIKEEDEKINELEKKCNEERERSVNAIKNYDITFRKNEVYQTQLNELETTISEKNKEIDMLKEQVNNKVHSEESIDSLEVLGEEQVQDGKPKKLTMSYLIKLNEGNLKIIQIKSDKIKKLEEELFEISGKNKDLETLCAKLDKDITGITQDINNSKKKSMSFQEEINLLNTNTVKKSYNNDYISLRDHSERKENQCKFCCIF